MMLAMGEELCPYLDKCRSVGKFGVLRARIFKKNQK